MSRLSEKIAKAREFSRTFDGWKLKLRRPTDAEAARLLRGDVNAIDIAGGFVCGWEDVKESDLVRGGRSDPVEFDQDAWREILADLPELWEPITTAVIESWSEHNGKREDRAKN